MKLHKYKTYKEYKDIQVKANKKKIACSWVDTNAIKMLVQYIHEYNTDVKFGLCHGTRQGLEQQAFIDSFGELNKKVKVIGTEISSTATTFPHTIEWDFHNTKKEWLNKVDFIYSNSFDHSFDPEKCLNTWMSCLNEKGLCIIEWAWPDSDKYSGTARDPFGATLEEYRKLITKNYKIIDILQNDKKYDTGKTFSGVRNFMIIKK